MKNDHMLFSSWISCDNCAEVDIRSSIYFEWKVLFLREKVQRCHLQHSRLDRCRNVRTEVWGRRKRLFHQSMNSNEFLHNDSRSGIRVITATVSAEERVKQLCTSRERWIRQSCFSSTCAYVTIVCASCIHIESFGNELVSSVKFMFVKCLIREQTNSQIDDFYTQILMKKLLTKSSDVFMNTVQVKPGFSHGKRTKK